MVLYFKFQQTTHHALYLLYSRVAEFNYPAAINANNMIMLFITI